MGDVGTEVGDRYWHNTLLDSASLLRRGIGVEGSPDEPPKFKSYPGLRALPLPQRLPSRLGPVTAAFGEHVPGDGRTAPLDADTLGALLHYGYGLSRVDVGPLSGWPYHRTVPSARCFYPTELYLWLPEDGARPAGVYHYDQLHHAIVPIRRGDHRSILGAAAGADLDGAAAVLLLTSHLWKTAFRYRHYAYRLCTQEAGMTAGNLLMVAGCLGLAASVRTRFLDEVTDRLLGVVPAEERTMAVLPIFPSRPAATAEELLTRLPEISPAFRDVQKDVTLASDTYEIDAHSVLTDLRPPAPPDDVDLVEALRLRNSGGTLFKPVRRPMAAADFRRLALAAAPYSGDLGTVPLGTSHLVAQHVTGVDPGVYRLPGLDVVGEMPQGGFDEGTGPPIVDMTGVNAMFYVVANRDRMTERFGARGYRIANLDAGIAAQRLCVLAGAAGLAARPLNGYRVASVQRLLGVVDPAELPMFQIAVGHRTVNAQYEMPIVF
ncbi:SagB family peptide dehydrogenase [Rhizohabitans arisaemae]|uniref:SagB family peptide dehydrogenase n=1 Tax=Rhizohabitans arisaemae TaxID=2720610 RepID=UPI0024B05893|nr:SagB family peptide dehydrogenase [Rhizohabitans arisaemae]